MRRLPAVCLTAFAISLAQALTAQTISPASHAPEIPAVPAQSTAATTFPVGKPLDPRATLPSFTPVYPYSAVSPLAPTTGLGPVTTLGEAIALAYRNSPQLLAQRDRLRSTDFRLPEARARYGPTIDATASYAFSHDRTYIIPGTAVTQQGFTSAASLILRQPVFTFGRNKAAESSAVSEIAFDRDTLRIVEAQVMLDAVTAYVSVLRDAVGVTIASQNVALLERQYTDSVVRFRVTEISATDLRQVETRLQFARGQLLTAKGELGASQGRFLRDVGAPPGDLRPPDVLTVPVADIGEAYAIADAESPVIRAAQSREKISRSAVQDAKAEFLPRVDLRSSADYGSVTPYSDSRRTTQLRSEAIVTMPLVSGGLREARLGAAREGNQADWRLIDQAQRETRSAVAEAWNRLAASRAALGFYLNAVEAARQAYKGGLQQERAGVITTVDLLDLARDLITVQNNYNTALANEYLARASLLSAMGRLEAPRLVNVPSYDATAHFREIAHRSDLPLLTPLLSALDGIVLPAVYGDRPIRDPAASTSTTATLAMPPESTVIRVDPTVALGPEEGN